MTDTVAVILAGGEGRRIGGDKPVRRLAGIRLIDIVRDRLAAWELEAAMAIKTEGQVDCDALIKIFDRPGIGGPLGGLLAGLAWARRSGAEWLLTVPCDMPDLPSDLYARLSALSRSSRVPAVAASRGRLHPVCTVWPVGCLDAVTTYAQHGARSLRGALEWCHAEPCEWDCGPDDPFLNINTLQELAHAAKIGTSTGRAGDLNP